MIGQSVSATSTGMLAMLAQGLARPSLPSATGRPPQVPTTSSLYTHWSPPVRPVKNARVLPPSPAAGTRSGMICESAPFITSDRR